MEAPAPSLLGAIVKNIDVFKEALFPCNYRFLDRHNCFSKPSWRVYGVGLNQGHQQHQAK